MSETVSLAAGIPSQIQPGLVIAGKYRLEEEIGRGSMGTVYRAVHVTLGQRVAIKLISAEHSQSVEARKRFHVEAKAAAKLRSRHVVQVIDDGETELGNPYIVLEYLEGETLEQRIEREHDVPLSDAMRIVTHVGRALARAHAQGIVHRDLKPANIFLVRSDDDEAGWVAKVLDFGIAKLEQGEIGTTQAGTVLGTPLFMSPEQVRGASSVDHRADLYSLGMCLFHMLTGEFAYYSVNYSDTLVGICTQPLPRLREKAPWVPEAVEQWFQRACAKERMERFQSADEMTEALQAAGGSPPLSKHKSVPEGRIAAGTLVGFAAPPGLATMQNEAMPLSLARTQAVAQPQASADPQQAAAPAPIAIHITSDERAATNPQWGPPPRRDFRPLVIGIGLGIVALAIIAGALALFRGRSVAVAPSAATAAPATLPSPSVALDAVPTPPVAPGVDPAAVPKDGSSVAAESAPSPSASPDSKPDGKPKAGEMTKKAGSAPAQRPARSAAPSKAASSDLGF